MRVGLCIPISERGPERHALGYPQMREFALLADQGGLDSIWVADHLLFRRPERTNSGAWESLAVLAAMAEATERVELGPLVLCAPFRNPGLIAWMANTLDAISGGRFVLGLGAGWNEPEFGAFAFEFERRVSVLADTLSVVVPLLRDGHVSFDGEWARGEAELRPPPVREGGPPILIAGTRPRMMALTARWADRWNSVWYGLPTDEFREERAALLDACAAVGRDPASIEVSAGIAVGDPRSRSTLDVIEGDAGSIAHALAAWRNEGVAEVICRLEPPSVGLVEEVVRAAELFHRESQ